MKTVRRRLTETGPVTDAATPSSRRRLSLTGICAAAGLVWLAFADLVVVRLVWPGPQGRPLKGDTGD